MNVGGAVPKDEVKEQGLLLSPSTHPEEAGTRRQEKPTKGSSNGLPKLG